MRKLVLLWAMFFICFSGVFGEDEDSPKEPSIDYGKTIIEHTQKIVQEWDKISKSIALEPKKVGQKVKPIWSYLEASCFTSEIEKENPIDLEKMVGEISSGNFSFGKDYNEYQDKWKDNPIRYPLIKDLSSKYSKVEMYRYQAWINSFKDVLEDFRDDKPEIVNAGVKVMTLVFSKLNDWSKPSGKNTSSVNLKCLLELIKAHTEATLLGMENDLSYPQRMMRPVWEESDDSLMNIVIKMSWISKDISPKISEKLATLKTNTIPKLRDVKELDFRSKEYKKKYADVCREVIKDIVVIINEIKDN